MPYDVSDEPDDEDLLDNWEELDAAAARILHTVLGDVLVADPPPELDRLAPALLAALAEYDAGHRDADDWFSPFDETAGEDEDADDDDAAIWVRALASTIEAVADPAEDDPDADVVVTHPAWLAAVCGTVLAGPGTDASAAALVGHLRSGPFEIRLEADEEASITLAFEQVLPRWQALGVVDDAGRLSELGAWGLPQALHDLWCDGEWGDEDLLAQGAAGARLHWESAPQEWTPELYAEAAALLATLAETPLAVDLTDEDGWQPFLERVHAETGAAAPAYLLAVRAEWTGDVEAQSRWIAATLAAEPDYAEALQVAATEAGDRGDAVAARDLLRRAGVDPGDSELATYVRFAQPPTGGPSRNAPCPCGSGRKYKMCCGARIGHPLPERASWLLEKIQRFTACPPQRPQLLDWAERFHGDEDVTYARLVQSVMTVPLITDVGLFDGGLLERYLRVRGPLLPADEFELATQWLSSRRTANEVTSTRPGATITLRDLHSDVTTEVRERTASREVRRGDLLLARILPTGKGAMLALVLAVPRQQRSRLLEVVSAEPEALFGWLQDAARPPRLTNTEGHELVVLEQRWRLSSAGWDALAAVLEPEGDDELHEMYEDDAGARWLRARLVRKADDVVVEINSRERADRVAQRLRDADPGAELLSETESDPSALRAVPDPVEMTPDVQEALQQMLRQHEQRWVDESIPMFGGRTPRDMVRTAAGRRQVEDFLADLDAMPPPAGPLPGAGMDPGRIRALLGLPAVLR